MLLSASRAARKNTVALRGGERMVRDSRRDIDPQRDAGDVEKLAGEGGEVIDQRAQRVLARIDGPDDFIETLTSVFGLGGKLIERGMERSLRGIFGSEGGEDGDLGEAGTEIVMQIAGDACAFRFAGAADSERLEPRFQPLAGNEPPAARGGGQHEHSGR